jgi:two-component system, chemotaxis family, chemotaxis protein CheY
MKVVDATTYNILVVDDSATTRAMIKRAIRLSGLPVSEIFEAGSGDEGLDVLRSHAVGLVLADLNMPVMSGAEMTRRIRNDPQTKGVPVVIVSAEPDDGRLMQLQGECVCDYVRKPFTPEAIRDAVRHAMEVRDV